MRQRQHKDRSEKSEQRELVAELKRQNHQLKREVSRLQRELQHQADLISEDSFEDAPETKKKPASAKCSKCQSEDIRTLTMPHGKLTVCKSCGEKTKS